MRLLAECAAVHYQVQQLVMTHYSGLGMCWPVMHQCAERLEPELVWLLTEVMHYLLLECGVVHYQLRLLVMMHYLAMCWLVMHQRAEKLEPELGWAETA